MQEADDIPIAVTPLQLLDVLEQLPRSVLRTNLWLLLTDDHASPAPAPPPPGHSPRLAVLGRAFRLTCRRSWQLTDQLTRRLHLTCDTRAAGYKEDQQVQRQGAFLARQDGLEQLTLADNGRHQGDNLVIKTLLLGGDAVCQRLQLLHISTPTPCTVASARAVQLFCPNLREVAFHAMRLEAGFFVRLHSCAALTKVSVCVEGGEMDWGDLTRSLAALPRLRVLKLGGTLPLERVEVLSHLTGLEELHAGAVIIHAGPADGPRLGQALGSLTRLTKLVTPEWRGANVDDTQLIIDSAVGQLSGLRRLAALSIDGTFCISPVLDFGLSAAVYQMSALTRLACLAAYNQPGHGTGCLPLLQHLRIAGGGPSGLDLFATLRPLTPLLQLRTLSVTLLLDDDRNLAEEDVEADGEVGEAWAAAEFLTQAPLLERVHLTVEADACTDAVMLAPAMALLVPVRDRLTTLRLAGLQAQVLSILLPVLSLAGSLETLSVENCRLTDGWLQLAVRHLRALRRLQVRACAGVVGDSAVALAAQCVRPLRVVWLPRLTVVEYAGFWAVAAPGVTVSSDWESEVADGF